MAFTAEQVKNLREQTGAGMMDCKRALEASGGDMEGAVEALRKKGMALAQKKSAREAKEGQLGMAQNGTKACFVEVNCETDFVVNTDHFQKFVSHLTHLVLEKAPKDLEGLLALPMEGKKVGEFLTELIAKIGENIQIRRFVHWNSSAKEAVGVYLHAGSKIGVMVRVADAGGKAKPDHAKEIAMHVAAMNPKFLRADNVPPATIEKEKEILRAGVDPKKPKELQDKIIEGKLKKYFSEECLENQIFIKDPEGKRTVADWLKGISATAKIEEFVRLQVGS